MKAEDLSEMDLEEDILPYAALEDTRTAGTPEQKSKNILDLYGCMQDKTTQYLLWGLRPRQKLTTLS